MMRDLLKAMSLGILFLTPPAFASDTWWTDFGDPLLDQAVQDALVQNPDLAASRARGKQATAVIFQQASGSLPQVSLGANSSWAPVDSLGFGMGFDLPGDPNAPKSYSSGQANLQASWNVDIFGQNGALILAADRDAKAAKADIRGLELAISSQVAEAYWDAVAARKLLAVAEEQVVAQESLLEALTLRYSDSDAGALDVLQQRQQVATAKVQVPQRRIQEARARQRLAVLLGKSPSATVPVADDLPVAPEPLAESDLSAAIQARPDVVAASKRLQAAKSRQWSAWAAAMPQIGVNAQTGVQFFDSGDWTTQNVWSAGASVSIPIFTGGRTYGGIRQARAAVREAEARTLSTELAAAEQAYGAWVRDGEQISLLAALDEQQQAADQAWGLAREHVLQGIAPYLNAQAALSRKQQAELSVVQGQRDALAARVALIQSLGGHRPQEERP